MSDQKYNGWTNHETWLVNVWITNDEGLDSQIRSSIRGMDKFGAKEAMKSTIEEMVSIGGSLTAK